MAGSNGAGQLDHGRLAAGIGRLDEMALQRQVADGVDDAPPAFTQRWQRGAAGQHRAAHVDRIGAIPQARVHAFDVAIVARHLGPEQRSIVVQHIKPAKVGDNLRDHCLDRCFIGEVKRHRDGTGQLRGERSGARKGNVGQRHAGATRGQQAGRRLADSARPTGDDGNLAVHGKGICGHAHSLPVRLCQAVLW